MTCSFVFFWCAAQVVEDLENQCEGHEHQLRHLRARFWEPFVQCDDREEANMSTHDWKVRCNALQGRLDDVLGKLDDARDECNRQKERAENFCEMFQRADDWNDRLLELSHPETNAALAQQIRDAAETERLRGVVEEQRKKMKSSGRTIAWKVFLACCPLFFCLGVHI